MIEDWLEDFVRNWQNKDVAAVLDMFSNDVEYWETPFQKISSKRELEEEWAVVRNQYNIKIRTSQVHKNNPHVVHWSLTYEDASGKPSEWKGLYIIHLTNGVCDYFYQVGQSQ